MPGHIYVSKYTFCFCDEHGTRTPFGYFAVQGRPEGINSLQATRHRQAARAIRFSPRFWKDNSSNDSFIPVRRLAPTFATFGTNSSAVYRRSIDWQIATSGQWWFSAIMKLLSVDLCLLFVNLEIIELRRRCIGIFHVGEWEQKRWLQIAAIYAGVNKAEHLPMLLGTESTEGWVWINFLNLRNRYLG